jgi:hypothetical protein
VGKWREVRRTRGLTRIDSHSTALLPSRHSAPSGERVME